MGNLNKIHEIYWRSAITRFINSHKTGDKISLPPNKYNDFHDASRFLTRTTFG